METIDYYFVCNWLKKDRWVLNKEASIKQALHYFVQSEHTELPVVENGCLLGIITLQDCLSRLEKHGDSDEVIASIIQESKHTKPATFSMREIERIPLYVITDHQEFLGAIGKQELLAFHRKSQPADKKSNRYTKGGKAVYFQDILGESPELKKTKKIAQKAAQSLAPVLITGESGVGKEQFARAIHYEGITNTGPLVSVNCAAIPENLLESELFGYADGAFTGAKKNGKPGKFELAHKGTLFLDEIGDMPLLTQVKILRVLQEKEVERIGSTQPVSVNFRLITATNKDLKEMVVRGEFREDLYHRLHVIPLYIPPLRQRKSDIPEIIEAYMDSLYQTYPLERKIIDRDVLCHFFKYDWPGNVCELMNVVERMFVLSDHAHIGVKDIPNELLHQYQNRRFNRLHDRQKHLMLVQKEEERGLIESVLKDVKGNKSRAAEILGISRATLYNKLARFNA
ncbi:sigma-54-dependent Fis family transcriptional regulator [Bacillus sp. REN10]|uniref:sigma-54-dependent Fis family transcriptional regulator n=1 Tax=Bacillus sp. REN10 TaxID=2782541 RepID=UPI00193BFC51|nr:sigma-54-dependent Fis family transcriptional regulator [Bacillus sp. REN10]